MKKQLLVLPVLLLTSAVVLAQNWSLLDGGTLTGANTISSSATNPLVFDFANSQEAGYYSFLRGSVSGVAQVPHLSFRNDATRAITDGVTDVYLGPNNGNPLSAAGGNVGLGSYNLTQINRGGTWSGIAYYSYFNGDRNIAIGFQNGMNLTGGSANAASTNILIGNSVLRTSTQQSYNILIGYQTAMNMSIPQSGFNGQSNIALGQYIMQKVTGGTANFNTAIGPSVLSQTTTINQSNTFVGAGAGLNAQVVGGFNTVIGDAGFKDVTWSTTSNNFNSGVGASVFRNAIEGTNNSTAIGTSGMRWGGGSNNSTVGGFSGWTLRGVGNTAIGFQSAHVADNSYTTSAGTPYTGSNSTFIGYRAGYNAADAAVSNVMVIGNDFQPRLTPNNVYIGANNDLLVYAGSTERLRVLNNGNVGIGQTAPAYPLDVNGAINATSFLVNGVSLPYQAIQNSGIGLPKRANLDFTNGLVAVDNVASGKTDVKLGGMLSENTMLNLNANKLSLTNGVTDISFVFDPVKSKFIGGTNNTSPSGVKTFTWGDNNINNGDYGSAMFGELSEIDVNVGAAIAGGEGVYIGAYGGHSMGRGTAVRPGAYYSYIGGWWAPGTTTGKTNLKVPQVSGVSSFGYYGTDPAQADNDGLNASYSAIIGGLNPNLPATSPRSAIIAGNSIKARANDPDQVYVPNFNIIGNPINDNTAPQLLVRDGVTGQVKSRDVLSVMTFTWAPSGTDINFLTGNVGIGTPLTSNPNGYKLAVNGKIGAKDVHVETSSTTWPDYVFARDYRLPSLAEVEKFIQENNHLANVPSASEIEKNGHSLGEMDKVLLKKIEELTLYVIQQQKEIELLKKKVENKN